MLGRYVTTQVSSFTHRTLIPTLSFITTRHITANRHQSQSSTPDSELDFSFLSTIPQTVSPPVTSSSHNTNTTVPPTDVSPQPQPQQLQKKRLKITKTNPNIQIMEEKTDTHQPPMFDQHITSNVVQPQPQPRSDSSQPQLQPQPSHNIQQRFKCDVPQQSQLDICVDENSSAIECKILSGEAEVFGYPLLTNQTYRFAAGGYGIHTWHGATIELKGVFAAHNKPKLLFTPRDEQKTPMIKFLNLHAFLEKLRTESRNVPMTISRDLINVDCKQWTELQINNTFAANINSIGPRMLILGPMDSGKSSLCRTLLNYAHRKKNTPLFLDLDPGQNTLSVPGTVGGTVIHNFISPFDKFLFNSLYSGNSGNAADDNNDNNNASVFGLMRDYFVYYFGHSSPRFSPLLYNHFLYRCAILMKRILLRQHTQTQSQTHTRLHNDDNDNDDDANTADGNVTDNVAGDGVGNDSNNVRNSGVIINACGYIDGIEAHQFIECIIKTFAVNCIAILEHEGDSKLKDLVDSISEKQKYEIYHSIIPRSNAVTQRSTKQRQNARSDAILNYFYGRTTVDIQSAPLSTLASSIATVDNDNDDSDTNNNNRHNNIGGLHSTKVSSSQAKKRRKRRNTAPQNTDRKCDDDDTNADDGGNNSADVKKLSLIDDTSTLKSHTYPSSKHCFEFYPFERIISFSDFKVFSIFPNVSHSHSHPSRHNSPNNDGTHSQPSKGGKPKKKKHSKKSKKSKNDDSTTANANANAADINDSTIAAAEDNYNSGSSDMSSGVSDSGSDTTTTTTSHNKQWITTNVELSPSLRVKNVRIRDDWLGNVIAVTYAQHTNDLLKSNIAGFLCVKEIDWDSKNVRCLSSVCGPLPGLLLFGKVRWFDMEQYTKPH